MGTFSSQTSVSPKSRTFPDLSWISSVHQTPVSRGSTDPSRLWEPSEGPSHPSSVSDSGGPLVSSARDDSGTRCDLHYGEVEPETPVSFDSSYMVVTTRGGRVACGARTFYGDPESESDFPQSSDRPPTSPPDFGTPFISRSSSSTQDPSRGSRGSSFPSSRLFSRSSYSSPSGKV